MNLQGRIGRALGTSIILLGTTAMSTTVPGCYTIRQVPIKQESEYQLRHSCPQNTVLIDLFDDKAECKTIFNHPLTEKGYLPILLITRNKSTDQYVIPRIDITFTDSNGVNWEQVTGLRMAQSFHRIPALEGAAVGVISPIAGLGFAISAHKWNEEIDRDYNTEKMMKTLMVYPSSRASGCVYFREPRVSKTHHSFSDQEFAKLVDGAELVIPLVNIANGQKETIEVLLKPD